MSDPDHFVEMSGDQFLREALEILRTAQSRDICLRILGALAVYAHSLDKSECANAFEVLGRFGESTQLFTDLDLVGYGKQRKEITKLFRDLHFRSAGMINAVFGDRRMIYYHPQNKYQVDIFFDKLEFSHDVEFAKGAGRLELDFPTITLTDISLEKLQIHLINRKDLVDLAVLFLGHDVKEKPENDSVDGGYIAGILSADWGFWYDAGSNLDKVKSLSNDFVSSGKLTPDQAGRVTERIDKLAKIIENASKTDAWRKRASVGTSKAWFRQVDEFER